MAVAKKRVSIPEAAAEFWEWADQQNDIGSSLVFIVKAFINKYGNGDAICNYAFGDIVRAEKKVSAIVTEQKTEQAKPEVKISEPVAEVQRKAPEPPVIQNIKPAAEPVSAPVLNTQPVRPVQPAVVMNEIAAMLDGEDNSSSGDDSDDMLSSMLNL